MVGLFAMLAGCSHAAAVLPRRPVARRGLAAFNTLHQSKAHRRRELAKRASHVIRTTDEATDGVRVRFAPSPTGTLHIGGARTALFNWLVARNKGGQFVVRIEDTDTARSTRESEESMLQDLRWLGLDWDEGPDKPGEFGPYRQSERGDIYTTLGKELLDKGLAYPCFCTEEELEAKRQEAEANKLDSKYDGTWRDADPDLVQAKMDAGEPYTVRFKVPSGARVEIEDLVRGEVAWDAESTVGDFIILRSSGVPVYNFCVAVDDALMKITHVIRAEEHLTNTLRQALILDALGYPLPTYAHCSLILGSDRSKLSKRHGATSVDQFRRQGFLRDAMINYLAGLGWNDGTDQEIYEEQELVDAFALDRVIKSSAVFDNDKLKWVNGMHIRKADPTALEPLVAEALTEAGVVPEPTPELSSSAVAVSVQSMELIADAADIVKACLAYPLDETLASDEAQKLVDDDFAEVAAALVAKFEAGEVPSPSDADFDAQWKALVKSVGKDLGRKGKRLFHPTRVAVTGRMSGPDIGEQLKLVNKAEPLGLGGVVPLAQRFEQLAAWLSAQ